MPSAEHAATDLLHLIGEQNAPQREAGHDPTERLEPRVLQRRITLTGETTVPVTSPAYSIWSSPLEAPYVGDTQGGTINVISVQVTKQDADDTIALRAYTSIANDPGPSSTGQ